MDNAGNYFEWINGLTSGLVKFMESLTGRPYKYNLKIASGASAHAEHLARTGIIKHTPQHLWRGAEIIYPWIVDGEDFAESARGIAKGWFESPAMHGEVMRNWNTMGAGIAIRRTKEDTYLIAVARFSK